MRKGGSSAKGSGFERKCARELSAWWYGSNGDGNCYLWRRPGSGYIKSLGPNRHTGDIIPAVESKPPPYRWPFHFELKFYRDLGLITLLTNPERSFIKKVWDKANAEKRKDLDVILLVKQNRQPELVFMNLATYVQLGLNVTGTQVVFDNTVGFLWASMREQSGLAIQYFKNK